MAVAVFHYPGGKAKLASWIVDRLPPPGSYGVFVDVFGGSASVLLEIMRRNDDTGEHPHYVYNDREGLKEPLVEAKLVVSESDVLLVRGQSELVSILNAPGQEVLQLILDLPRMVKKVDQEIAKLKEPA